MMFKQKLTNKTTNNEWRIIMKLNYSFVLLALIAGVIFWPAQRASAQDTLVVECWDEGEVIVNALRNAIAGDTTSTGEHVAVSTIPNRVYKLYRGGYYWLEDRIENDGFHLRIVGEEPGTTLQTGPAVIQMVEDADGNVDGRIMTGLASVTLKNLWLTGNDDVGVQTYYQPIQIDASDSRFVFENCVLTRTNFAPIAFTGSNNDIFYKNCVFRNLIGHPSTQQWEGRGASIWADQDTVVVENCTFFNVGMTAFQLEGGSGNYVRINHNTFVNVGRQIAQGAWWQEAYFANNLIVNGFWHGEGNADVTGAGRDPEALNTGMFIVDALPSSYGPEQGRRIAVANTASWRDPVFASYYSDSIVAQPIIGNLSMDRYFSVYDNMVVIDTMWLDPGLATTFSSTQYDSMIQNIEDLRAGDIPAAPYAYELPTQHTAISWPLPEDFSYTNSTLLTAGSDDLPLGDLNWFPADLATWEANKEQNIADVEALAGPKTVYTVAAEEEAEDGTLAGTATEYVFDGFSYFSMDGGYIEWSFELETAAQYDLDMWVHLNARATSGINFFVNDFEIHDDYRGWGQFILANDADGPWADLPSNDWGWLIVRESEIREYVVDPTTEPLHLLAGTNTIQLKASWCNNMFAGFNILEAGTETVVKELRAPDVTDYQFAKPAGEGPFVPNGFKSVKLGTDGSVTWNMLTPANGEYVCRIFYQNPGASVTGLIKVDGVDALTGITFVGDPDSVGLDFITDAMAITAGAHAITLSGNSINLDRIQLIQKEVISSIKPDNIPYGYALMQNYPNPFNPTTTINYSIGKNEHVKLVIYNVLGQEVKTLVNRNQLADSYMVIWDGTSDTGFQVSTGIYFCKMITPEFTKTQKMMLLK